LYSHQAESIEHVMAGRNTAVVTGTASGKTLCYNLPVMNALADDDRTRALYVFPTKALAQDQYATLHSLIEAAGLPIKTHTYDGDTPANIRRLIRQAGHIVLTNPDMLHSGILPHHTKWHNLFENLRYVVIEGGPHAIGVAGVAVGLLIVPLVASISDDAMRSVPRSLREGAYALGASKLRVSARVVLPAALSGIVAAMVLAVSRAIGETMVVLMAAGARPQITFDPTQSAQTMTAFIGQTATGEISFGTIAYYTIFAVGALLFAMTLVMNLFAIRLVRRFREVYE
jgi:hypothetical protein